MSPGSSAATTTAILTVMMIIDGDDGEDYDDDNCTSSAAFCRVLCRTQVQCCGCHLLRSGPEILPVTVLPTACLLRVLTAGRPSALRYGRPHSNTIAIAPHSHCDTAYVCKPDERCICMLNAACCRLKKEFERNNELFCYLYCRSVTPICKVTIDESIFLVRHCSCLALLTSPGVS